MEFSIPFISLMISLIDFQLNTIDLTSFSQHRVYIQIHFATAPYFSSWPIFTVKPQNILIRINLSVIINYVQVETILNQYKMELIEKRYRFNTGIVMGR